jgi:hypothetical protein
MVSQANRRAVQREVVRTEFAEIWDLAAEEGDQGEETEALPEPSEDEAATDTEAEGKQRPNLDRAIASILEYDGPLEDADYQNVCDFLAGTDPEHEMERLKLSHTILRRLGIVPNSHEHALAVTNELLSQASGWDGLHQRAVESALSVCSGDSELFSSGTADDVLVRHLGTDFGWGRRDVDEVVAEARAYWNSVREKPQDSWIDAEMAAEYQKRRRELRARLQQSRRKKRREMIQWMRDNPDAAVAMANFFEEEWPILRRTAHGRAQAREWILKHRDMWEGSPGESECRRLLENLNP